MTDIDSNQRSNTRMDQDNEKNVVSPKPGGNDMGIDKGQDIDESSRAKMDEQRRQQDEAQRLRESGDQEGDKGINIEGTEGLERDKHNP